MTTFTHTDSDGDELSVEPDGVARALVSTQADHGASSVYVDAESAPAFALALLDSTGSASTSVAVAVTHLRSHLAFQAKEKARKEAGEKAAALREQRARMAAEAEKLAALKASLDVVDEEATRLLNAYRKSMGMGPITAAMCVPSIFTHWREVARASLNS